ncbi:hypothetical protein AAG906_009614 [Vitis piasezkii]|uniref:Uncharacterized protein n=2 Tax=Vitis vinifera TaxID=29760 RepID=D7TCF3_VITVI|eukprot:XP_019078754.1 PREDICTED: uncharacterized protein LOC104880671 [Vitis vinifera]
MAQSLFYVTQEEFNMFHSIDRQLYTLLVVNLWRDPVESMQIIAFWLWLERSGFNNAVTKMLSLPYILVNELADEALTCLNCISNHYPSSSPDSHDIPLIQSLMEKEIDLQFFHHNRVPAAQGIAKIVKEVCLRGLKDIMDSAIERNKTQNVMESQMVVPPMVHTGLNKMGLGGMVDMGYGESEVGQPWNREIEVPPDDRTMFVTFSKGYPVYEWEVREFFGRSYGDCIESLYMQEVEANEQSLFARIVFHSASTIEMILNGMGKAKFTINAKHVWARKFVPKRAKPLSATSPASSSSPGEMPASPHLPLSLS